MGFSSGASKAKRKAKKAAAAQYYAAAADLTEVDENLRVSTDARRRLSDADVDIGVTRKARELDKLGRAIKNDTDYKETISKYNSRYRALKDQLAGKSVERYRVTNAPSMEGADTAPGSRFSPGSTPASGPLTGNTTQPTGLASVVGVGLKQSQGKERAKNTYFNTAEEAQAEAEKRMQAFNEKQAAAKRPGLIGLASLGRQQPAQATDPSQFVQKEVLPGIKVGYRQLNDFGDAFDELGEYADAAKASPVNQYAERYAALTKQLNRKLKSQAPTPSAATGLLGSELLTGRPTSEVIS